jgi:two-component system invasion response regulator UvrY
MPKKKAGPVRGGRQSIPEFHRASGVLKVLIADKSTVVRRGMEQILEELGPLDVTEADVRAAAFDFASGPWDIALVSIDLTMSETLQFLGALKRLHPEQPVLALACRSSAPDVVRALKSSIEGCVPKESTAEEIVTVVRRVLVSANPDTRAQDRGVLHPALSDRELEVLRLLSSGRSMKEIAAVLNISRH